MTELVFVEQHPLTGRIVPIASGATIGRDECDVVLPDPEVSRMHAVIRCAGDTIEIEDLGSTNGTWVNDRRTDGLTQLHEGDVVRFGNTVWHVTQPSAVTKVAGAA